MSSELALSLALAGCLSGALGAFAGIGGGVLLVPVLLLAFGFAMRDAVVTSLVSVLATSSAASLVYARRGLTHARLAMTLELVTAAGGVLGSLVAGAIAARVLAMLLVVVLVGTAAALLRPAYEDAPAQRGAPQDGALASTYVDEQTGASVLVSPVRIPLGMLASVVAGVLSGLLGIGGGVIKVPTMVLAMRVPTRVATATSTFMLGVTAAASLAVYAARGDVHPLRVAPVVLGALAGSRIGARAMVRVRPRVARAVLAAILVVVAAQLLRSRAGLSS